MRRGPTGAAIVTLESHVVRVVRASDSVRSPFGRRLQSVSQSVRAGSWRGEHPFSRRTALPRLVHLASDSDGQTERRTIREQSERWIIYSTN